MTLPCGNQQTSRQSVRDLVHGLCLLVLAGTLFSGCSSDPEAETQDGSASTSDASNSSSNQKTGLPATPQLPQPKSSVLRLYTSPAGLQVFVDGELATSDGGEPLVTPCAITVTHGDHEVRAAGPGFADAITMATVPDTEELTLEATADSDGAADSILKAPLLNLEVGESVPLESLNSPGQELDPYLTADGLQLWFVGDRTEGRGIYVSTRPTVWHHFDPPRFIEATRTRSLPATPSLAEDRLSFVYVIPEDARIWSTSRKTPFGDFTDRNPLLYSEDLNRRWLSAQMLADGSRLYWLEVADGQRHSRAAVRASTDDKFGKPLKFSLPGLHPCLTPDGLRQFSFDGTTLRRSWRPSLNAAAFSPPEVITTLELPNYVHSEERRQFHVSTDEQWMVYSDQAARDANLHMVRLSRGRGLGLVVTGKPIAAKQETTVAETEPTKPSDTPGASSPTTEQPPAREPLSYPVFRQQWLRLLGERDYDAASSLLEEHRSDFAGTDFANAIKWDEADLAVLLRFEEDARRALSVMRPGADMRLGTTRVKFVKFEDDVVYGDRNGSEVSLPWQELTAANLVALADEVIESTNEAAQFRVGVFLLHDVTGSSRTAQIRLRRSGQLGEMFVDQQAGRLLQQAQYEIGEGRLAAARGMLRELQETFGSTSWAQQAAETEHALYTHVRWETRGPRDWAAHPETGEIEFDLDRQNGAYLVSTGEWKRFQLELEWRTQGRAAQGGIFFRYPGSGRPYDNALKIQLANDAGVAADEFCTGSVFKVQAPSENVVRPEGEWNELQLRVDGTRLQLTINGTQVHDTTLNVAGIAETGYVAIDGEAGGITYRRILLMEWPEDKAETGETTGGAAAN